MHKVSSKDFQRNVGVYLERALNETITITRYGCDWLVLLDVAEYEQLRKRSRIAMDATELSVDEISQIEAAEMSKEYDHLNDELEAA